MRENCSSRRNRGQSSPLSGLDASITDETTGSEVQWPARTTQCEGRVGILAQPGLTPGPLFRIRVRVTPYFWEPHVSAGSSSHLFLDICCARHWAGCSAHRLGDLAQPVMITIPMVFNLKKKKNDRASIHLSAGKRRSGCAVGPACSCLGHNAGVTLFFCFSTPQECLNWEQH